QRVWPALLRLADGLPDQLISELAELLAEQDIAVINELVDAVAEEELWPELLPFARVLPAHVQATVADIARTLNPKVRADIVREAKRVGVLADLGPIADALTTKAA
ncbi:MAG: hypothetical protein ACRDQW_01850, partial [Haloechinothrix sp.]